MEVESAGGFSIGTVRSSPEEKAEESLLIFWREKENEPVLIKWIKVPIAECLKRNAIVTKEGTRKEQNKFKMQLLRKAKENREV